MSILAIKEILLSLLHIFLILIPGFILSKLHIISDEHIKGISNIVVNVTWPCLIISSLQMDFSKEILLNSIIVITSMAIVMVISYVLAYAACQSFRLKKSKKYIFTFMLIFANTGFIGIPITQQLYGSEGVFYTALYDSFSDIFVFSLGIVLMKKSLDCYKHDDIKHNHNYLQVIKVFVTPSMVSIYIGLALFLTSTALPDIVQNPISSIGSCTTPLAMIIVGFQIGKLSLRELFGDWQAYLFSSLRLLILPIIILLIAKTVFCTFSTITKVIILMSGLPAATCSIVFAEKYECNVLYTTKCTVLSTLLAIVTIPLLAVIMEF